MSGATLTLTDFEGLREPIAALYGPKAVPAQESRYQHLLAGRAAAPGKKPRSSPRRGAPRSAATIPTTSMAGFWPRVSIWTPSRR